MTTVLIVDDHPSSARPPGCCSRREGYDVVGEAPDGTSGDRGGRRASARPRAPRRQPARPRRLHGRAADHGGPGAPAVVLTSSRDGSDFGPLVAAQRRPGLHLQGRALRRGDRGASVVNAPRPPLRVGHARPAPASSRCSPSGSCAPGRRRARAHERPREPRRSPPRSSGRLIGLGFIGTGLFAWWRRPPNRFGALMTAVGFAWFLGALTASNDAVVFTIGLLLGPLYLVLVSTWCSSFPSGRLESRRPRRLVALAYVDVVRPARCRCSSSTATSTVPTARPTTRSRSSTAPDVGERDRRGHVAPRLRGRSGHRGVVLTGRRRRGDAAAAPRPGAGALVRALAFIVRAHGLVFASQAVGLPEEVIASRRARSASRVRRRCRSRSSPASCAPAARARRGGRRARRAPRRARHAA